MYIRKKEPGIRNMCVFTYIDTNWGTVNLQSGSYKMRLLRDGLVTGQKPAGAVLGSGNIVFLHLDAD